MWAKSLVLCCVLWTVGSHKPRKGRLFSFNFEDKDISVDMQFSLPFLSIPIKKTVDSLGVSEFPSINFNPAALLLGGAVVLGSTVLLPLVMKHYASNMNPDYRIARILDNTKFSADTVLGYVNEIMADGSGFHGCALRAACWTGQKREDGLMRAMKRITSNKIVSAFINETSIEDAMLSGRSGRDCASYTPCPVQERYIPMLMDNLAMLSRNLDQPGTVNEQFPPWYS